MHANPQAPPSWKVGQPKEDRKLRGSTVTGNAVIERGAFQFENNFKLFDRGIYISPVIYPWWFNVFNFLPLQLLLL